MTDRPLLTKSMQRGLANNPQQRASVMNDVEGVFNPNIPFSKKPNARYGPAVFHAIMMGAAALGASIFGYTAAVRRWTTASCMLARGHRESPCGEWISNICLRVDPYGMAKSLEKAMSANLERLQSLGLLSGKRIDIAIDMHLIPRWDRKHGAELVRSKSKGKTGSFERYIAAQCIKPGMQMVLALLHMPALEDTACYVRKTISMCRRTGAKIGTVMLDREFFSTDVIRVLGDLGVDYLIPCVNTANVVKAIEEFSMGERSAISVFRIAKSKNDYVEYIMHITDRTKKSRKSKKKSKKKSKSESCVKKPEEKYIAFATNRPDIDVKRYSEGWMIETSFRMVENQRVRTRSRSVTVRTLCFLYSLVLFNSWVLANAELTGNPYVSGCIYSKITQTDMKIIIMMHTLPRNSGYEEPPSGLSPASSADVICRDITTVMSLPQ